MLAISRLAGAAVLTTALAAGPAMATGAAVNHVPLARGTTTAVCLQRAALAIASVGLSPLSTTRAAAWGQRAGGRIYAIYCLAPNGVAVFVGAGNTTADVSPDLTALMQAFRANASGGAGPGDGAGAGAGGGIGGKIPLNQP